MQPLVGQEALLSTQQTQIHSANDVLFCQVGAVSLECGVVM
jgi:hypothetical protein